MPLILVLSMFRFGGGRAQPTRSAASGASGAPGSAAAGDGLSIPTAFLYLLQKAKCPPPDLNPCLWALWVGSFYLLHLFLSDPGGEKEGKKSLCKEQRGGGCITW